MQIIDINLKFKSLSYGNRPKQILLHHLEWPHCTVQDVHQCHINDKGWSGIGYHFFVSKTGQVYKGRPENAIGAHCKGHNTNTLGIGAEGDYMKETMPQAQKNAIIELCKYLCDKYGITDVRGHKEAPYSTDCPGRNYPLQEIKNAIKGKTCANVSKRKYSINYCLKWQQFYNKVTQTKAQISEDGMYGKNTLNSLNSLHYYVKQGSKYKYCLEFQRWYNRTTQTSAPISEDGLYGQKTEKAWQTISDILKDF